MGKYLERGIYLEASVLVPLPLYIMNGEMERLLELSTKLGREVWLPEISFKEWLPKKIDQVKKQIENLDNEYKKLTKIFDCIKLDFGKDVNEIIDEIEPFMRKMLSQNGIKTAPIPDIDLNRLIEMSVNKIPPFEESKEKGFRDSVNLFTVLENAKNNSDSSPILVAKDKIYSVKEIQELASEYEINLHVLPSIRDAINHLEQFRDTVFKEIDELRKREITDFLTKNLPLITTFIKNNGQFPPTYLRKIFDYGSLSSTVFKINDIEALEIESVSSGQLPGDKTEFNLQISFYVKTSFKITRRKYETSPEPNMRFGELNPTILESYKSALGTLSGYEEPGYKFIEEELEKRVRINGTVKAEKVQNMPPKMYKYSDLVLEEITPEESGILNSFISRDK